MKQRLLAIETSCDETSIAIIEDIFIISEQTHSQIANHAKFGGVIPELASRLHSKTIFELINLTLRDANCKLTDLDGIAVTIGPGLINSLQVGLTVAKSLAYSLNLPLYQVNHLTAHAYSPFIGTAKNLIPREALVVIASGGHSLLALKKGKKFEIIGQTKDDAIGEVYDKVAKMLGLPYPGGPAIDEIAQKHFNDSKVVSLPRPKVREYDLSFSGLKSAVYNLINNRQIAKEQPSQIYQEEIATAFQKAAIDHFITKIKLALNDFNQTKIIIGGGVTINSYFQSELKQLPNVKVFFPKNIYTGDNAAMIAYTAAITYNQNLKNEDFDKLLQLDSNPNLIIGELVD